MSRGPGQAHRDGFDLHANVWVAASAGLERLCRYVPRPPFAQEHLRLPADRRIALALKRTCPATITRNVGDPDGS